jgi:hypothetical protein
MLAWTNPNQIVIDKDVGVIYLATIEDADGREYRYVGKTRRGRHRMKEYSNNIRRIFEGLPRRTTPDQMEYRTVHFALAQAVEHGWKYALHPVENVSLEELNAIEMKRIIELGANLNDRGKWRVEDYRVLTLKDFF